MYGFSFTTTIDRANKAETTSTSSNTSDLSAVSVVVNGLLMSQSSLTVANASTFQYDGLGRRTHVTDPATGQVTQTIYNASGQVEEVIEPGGGSTKYVYYPAGGANAGQLKSMENALGKMTYYAYDDQGRLTHQWGDVPNPIRYEYDLYGNRVKMHTYRADGGIWTGESLPGAFTTAQPSTTTWVYDAATKQLLQKLDAAGQGASYQYSAAGLMTSRTWARGVVTSYQHNQAGEVINISYSDGTPAISHTLRRDGRRLTTVDAAGTHSYQYSNPGAAFSRETIIAGMLDGLTLDVLNDGVSGQRTAFSASYGGQVLQSVAYGYDAKSRLASVSSGAKSFTYSYAANSNQIASVVSAYQGNQVLSGQRIYDNNQRLDSITYSVGAGGAKVVSMHDYQYDLLHRRTRATREDAYYWQYGYNDRNEVISARKFTPDDSGLAGWNSGYKYGAIGNRLWADRGGDAAGANMRRTSYTSNALNQYTNINNAGGFDVLGKAVAAATVTVNGTPAQRQGELFRKEISVDNSAGLVRQSVNITATLPGAGLNGADVVVQRNGNKVLRSANETLTHDLDGNLLSDDRWSYTWDGENRLIAIETSAAAISAGVVKRRWQFDYDSQGRRVRKSIFGWDVANAAWVQNQQGLLIYDGWNLVAELDGMTGDLLKRYTWGLDVSGTMQGAGGVGGLLSMEDFTGLPIPLYYSYDGNGNVMALVRATDGAVVAEYEYSAFGELLRAEGEASDLNPCRHATKYQDETGLLYYGFRYYSAESGRWLSRDPIGERGGVNLMGFVGNDGVNGVDVLGAIPRVYFSQSPGIKVAPGERAQNKVNFYNAFRRVGQIKTIATRIAVHFENKNAPASGKTKSSCEKGYRELSKALRNIVDVMDTIQDYRNDSFELRFVWGFFAGGNAEAYVQSGNNSVNGVYGDKRINLIDRVVDPGTFLHELAHFTRLAPTDKETGFLTPLEYTQAGPFYNSLGTTAGKLRKSLERLTGKSLERVLGVEHDVTKQKALFKCCEFKKGFRFGHRF